MNSGSSSGSSWNMVEVIVAVVLAAAAIALSASTSGVATTGNLQEGAVVATDPLACC